MPQGPRQQGYDGLANLSHSVRRSMALYVAMNMTQPEDGMEMLFQNADRCAEWIKGKALSDDDAEEVEESGSLGQPWHEVTGEH